MLHSKNTGEWRINLKAVRLRGCRGGLSWCQALPRCEKLFYSVSGGSEVLLLRRASLELLYRHQQNTSVRARRTRPIKLQTSQVNLRQMPALYLVCLRLSSSCPRLPRRAGIRSYQWEGPTGYSTATASLRAKRNHKQQNRFKCYQSLEFFITFIYTFTPPFLSLD